jgi:polysaccharide pyruvyl transferase WcaK-like protein
MKIGLVGYYGWGNYGDELFLKSFQKNFTNHQIILFHDGNESKFLDNSDELIDSVDCIVIGGGDLLIPWYRSWLYWDERYLQKPIYIYGIGVPTWGECKQDILDFYAYFLNHKNIYLISCRDQESVEWIHKNLHVNYSKLNFFADIVLSNQTKYSLASKTVGLILRLQPSYDKDNIYMLINTILKAGYGVRLIFLGTHSTLKDDWKLLREFEFYDIDIDIVMRDSFDKLTEEIASCSYIISQKFHGCIMAYVCKKPFITLSTADKFVSFCKSIDAEKYISWDGDPDLCNKFKKLISTEFDFSLHRKLHKNAKDGLRTLRKTIFENYLKEKIE